MFKLINIWAYCYHIESTCTKARKLLGLLYRQFSNNTTSYGKTLSIPCETTLAIWSSSLAPIYRQRYTHIGESSAVWITYLYEALEFELPISFSYRHWRIGGFFLSFFKIIHNLIYFPVNFHSTPLSSLLRCNHDQQYSIPFARTNHFKYSFLPNCISVWNNLPLEVVNCTTLPMFKYYTLPLFLLLLWVRCYISSSLFVHVCINFHRNYTQTFAINEIGPMVTQDCTLAKLAILV